MSVPLPRGKVLHLGPGKSGTIASNAVEHPGLQKLVAGGEIEITGEGSAPAGGFAGGGAGRTAMQGWTAGRGGRRSGDR